MYEPFCADFGPLNLGNTFRFCQKLSALLKARRVLPAAAWLPSSQRADGRVLQAATTSGRPVCFYCGPSLTKRANAAVLVRQRAWPALPLPLRNAGTAQARAAAQIGSWQVLCAGCPVDEAVRLVNSFGPFAVFRDASNVPSDFRLTPEDCLRVGACLCRPACTRWPHHAAPRRRRPAGLCSMGCVPGVSSGTGCCLTVMPGSS